MFVGLHKHLLEEYFGMGGASVKALTKSGYPDDQEQGERVDECEEADWTKGEARVYRIG